MFSHGLTYTCVLTDLSDQVTYINDYFFEVHCLSFSVNTAYDKNVVFLSVL